MEVAREARCGPTKSALLCGIETHACILHTALDLLEQDLDVHVLVDCCSSRSMADRFTAFKRMRDVGVFLTTSECVILGMAADSAHPKFKALQKLVHKSAPDTGLLQDRD
jgi:isochorismate hydrolase